MISFCIITLLLAPLMWAFGKMYFQQEQLAHQARTSFERKFASINHSPDVFGIESGSHVGHLRVPSTIPLISLFGKWTSIRCHRLIGGIGLIATMCVLVCGGIVCFINGYHSTAVVRVVDGQAMLEWLEIENGSKHQS